MRCFSVPRSTKLPAVQPILPEGVCRAERLGVKASWRFRTSLTSRLGGAIRWCPVGGQRFMQVDNDERNRLVPRHHPIMQRRGSRRHKGVSRGWRTGDRPAEFLPCLFRIKASEH